MGAQLAGLKSDRGPDRPAPVRISGSLKIPSRESFHRLSTVSLCLRTEIPGAWELPPGRRIGDDIGFSVPYAMRWSGSDPRIKRYWLDRMSRQIGSAAGGASVCHDG